MAATAAFSRRSSTSSIGPVADSPVEMRGERGFGEDSVQPVPFSWMKDGGRTGLESITKLEPPVVEVQWDTNSPMKGPSPSSSNSGKFRSSSLTGSMPSALNRGSRRSSSVHFADEQPRLEHRPSVVTSPAGHITDWSLFLAAEGKGASMQPKATTDSGKVTTFSSSYSLPFDTHKEQERRNSSPRGANTYSSYTSSVSLPYDPMVGPSLWETTETVVSSDPANRRPSSSITRSYVHADPPADLSSTVLTDAKGRVSSLTGSLSSLTSSAPKVTSVTSSSISEFDFKEKVPSLSSLNKAPSPSYTTQLQQRFPGLTSYETQNRVPSISSYSSTFEQKGHIPSISSYTSSLTPAYQPTSQTPSYIPKERIPSVSSPSAVSRQVVEEDWSVFLASEANQPTKKGFQTEVKMTTPRRPTRSWEFHSVQQTSRRL